MALQLMGCTAPPVTRRTGELLPHLFTLTPTSGAVIFCSIYHILADIFLLGSMMPCVARTFLPPFKTGSDGTAC